MLRERFVSYVERLAPTPIAILALLLGLLVHFVGFFLFRVEIPSLGAAASQEAYVSFVQLDEGTPNQSLKDRALLLDSIPLFLPNEVDYNWTQLHPSQYLEDRHIELLEPYRYNVEIYLDEWVQHPFESIPDTTIEDVLRKEYGPMFATFGEKALPAVDMGDAFARFEWVLIDTGELQLEVEVDERPNDWGENLNLWRPSIISVIVEPDGQVGFPAVIQPSGEAVVDQFALVEISKQLARYRFRPGYYQVSFGR